MNPADQLALGEVTRYRCSQGPQTVGSSSWIRYASRGVKRPSPTSHGALARLWFVAHMNVLAAGRACAEDSAGGRPFENAQSDLSESGRALRSDTQHALWSARPLGPRRRLDDRWTIGGGRRGVGVRCGSARVRVSRFGSLLQTKDIRWPMHP